MTRVDGINVYGYNNSYSNLKKKNDVQFRGAGLNDDGNSTTKKVLKYAGIGIGVILASYTVGALILGKKVFDIGKKVVNEGIKEMKDFDRASKEAISKCGKSAYEQRIDEAVNSLNESGIFK